MIRSTLPLMCLAVACHPRVTFDVLRPAEITLPATVTRLAVVDRVGTDLSSRAAVALSIALVDSVRFEVTEQAAAQAAHRTGRTPAGAPLTAEHAGRICSQSGASGIVALERYQPSGDWSESVETREVSREVVETRSDGSEETVTITEEVPVYLATWTSRSAASWTVYDCNGTVLDGYLMGFMLSQDAEGASPGDARSAIGDPSAMDAELADSAGYAYFTHVSPFEDQVTRSLYRGGSSDVRAGWKEWKAGDIEGAEQRWKVATKTGGDRAKGRSLHNRAIAAEKRGDLDQAVKLERRAHKLLHKKLTEKTLRSLRHRRAQEGVLQEQLAEPAPTPAVTVQPPASTPEPRSLSGSGE